MSDHNATSFFLHLPSADDTAALGVALADHLRAGDVILLSGDIGTGKSHLARALISYLLTALGRPEDIPSPTFTLVQTYDVSTAELWHADLYRLSGPDEAVELGLLDAFENAICLIEWPDRLGADAPLSAVHIDLCVAPGGSGRTAQIEWGPDTAPHLADTLAQLGMRANKSPL